MGYGARLLGGLWNTELVGLRHGWFDRVGLFSRRNVLARFRCGRGNASPRLARIGRRRRPRLQPSRYESPRLPVGLAAGNEVVAERITYVAFVCDRSVRPRDPDGERTVDDDAQGRDAQRNVAGGWTDQARWWRGLWLALHGGSSRYGPIHQRRRAIADAGSQEGLGFEVRESSGAVLLTTCNGCDSSRTTIGVCARGRRSRGRHSASDAMTGLGSVETD